MKPLRPHKYGKSRPEAKIQKAIITYLCNLGWHVKATHGNAYTSGWPDLFASHRIYGHRWIEVKLPDFKGSEFTSAQIRDFPRFSAHGSGVWVMTAATEVEYNKLFAPNNWWTYMSAFRT